MTSKESITLITGGTGFIGRSLCAALLRDRQEKLVILTRRPQCHRHRQIEFIASFDELKFPPTRIVNLAGAPIADKRWDDERKQVLSDSRVGLTQALFKYCQQQGWHPDLLISASAIGYYGFDNPRCDESSAKGHGYAADLCAKWEEAAHQFDQLGTRICVMRLGVVLGQGGGALAKLLPMFKLGLGGPIGAGTQGFSWIQLEDVVRAIEWCMDNDDFSGVFNLCSPQPVSQREFAKKLASVLHRPGFVPTPAPVLRMIFGEMAKELLIGGQFVSPKKLVDLHFPFNFPDLPSALLESV